MNWNDSGSKSNEFQHNLIVTLSNNVSKIDRKYLLIAFKFSSTSISNPIDSKLHALGIEFTQAKNVIAFQGTYRAQATKRTIDSSLFFVRISGHRTPQRVAVNQPQTGAYILIVRAPGQILQKREIKSWKSDRFFGPFDIPDQSRNNGIYRCVKIVRNIAGELCFHSFT